MIAAAFFLFARLPRQERTPEFTRRRIVMDGSYVFLTIMLGYRLFLSFTSTEGVAHVALQTELSFAHAIQSTLVPPVSYCGRALDVYEQRDDRTVLIVRIREKAEDQGIRTMGLYSDVTRN
jgi:hypothetical protein